MNRRRGAPDPATSKGRDDGCTPLTDLHKYAKSNHTGYGSQEGVYCMIPSYEWFVLLEMNGIYFQYG
jgi:hypothetical protein